MSTLLYESVDAVAKLNEVEGFRPLSLARIIKKEGQADQLYLDVKYRKLWFRLRNPQGKIIKKILAIKDNMAIVEARIYLDKDDPEDSYIASALSQKYRSEDPQFGDKFLELAETAAVGRALGDAGYGIQFADADIAEEDDPNQVDAGIPVKEPFAQAGMGDSNIGAPVPPQAEVPQPFGNGYQNPGYYQPSGGQVPFMGNQAAPGNPSGQGTQYPPLPDRSQPVEALLSQLTYEQAKNVVIGGSGINGGKTMGQLAVENPGSLKWYQTTYKGPDNLLRAAARILLEKAAA